jgi:Domain of unknown function (DUF6933)
MVILRPTRNLSSLLPATGISRSSSDTALGDWYVNRIIVHRQPLLLLVSSASFLSMLVRARDVRNLPVRLADLVEARLKYLGIDIRAIDAERSAMARAEIAPTVNRSVLGIMVDFAKSVPYYLKPGCCNATALRLAEERLAETPCHAGKPFDQVIFPDKKTAEVLHMKWIASDKPGISYFNKH